MTFRRLRPFLLFALLAANARCAGGQADEPMKITAAQLGGLDPESLRLQAASMFGTLPPTMTSTKRPLSDAKVALGRQLFYDPRLSKNQDLSCNSCHELMDYGVDQRPVSVRTSAGHRSQLGPRNAPTVYNAARQFAQFWDGRAIDVEEQAKGPLINPVEMAMTDGNAVVAVLKSIPGYAPLFQSAFGSANAITYDNVGIAIGAFERKLVSQDRFDEYMAGDPEALTSGEIYGLWVFVQKGCPSCHTGPGLGGASYQKLGVVKAYSTTDQGRFAVTKREADRYFFKVPSLRNVDETGPYFHDGSQPTLLAAIRFMAEYQTVNGTVTETEVNAIATFLKSLTGTLPMTYIAPPVALASGPTTPKPNPN